MKKEINKRISKNEATKNSTSRRIILIALIVLTAVAGVKLYQNKSVIFDWFASLSYQSTPEIEALENSTGMTDSAKLILHASYPSLESRETFNNYCKSNDPSVSILGCYTNGRIYLYDINEESLSGVKESTLAHELLHAVWDRLSGFEKNKISEKLTEVFNDERYNSLLSENLEYYDESERMGELHSRIGTEIVELPKELESHYAKYFKDQDAIVVFFNNYVTPFRELSDKIAELSEKIEALSNDIDDKFKVYYEAAEKLSAEINDFNECARTQDCFAKESDYRTKRDSLSSRKDALDGDFAKIDELVKQYSALVQEYNDNIVRGQQLESLINSNVKIEDIK